MGIGFKQEMTCWRTFVFFAVVWSGMRPKWMCGKWAHCQDAVKEQNYQEVHISKDPTHVKEED